jgi:hypothetical protein
MANTIRIKRRASGVGAGAPSGLANAELAYNEGDNILYYGFGTGGAGGTATQVIPIAGSGAYLNKNNNLSDLNNLQTSRNNLASNTVTSGLFMRGNGTNVLMGSIIASDVPTLNQNTTGSAGSVTSSLTINNGGAGDTSGSTFNGSVAKTISYNSIGSPSVGGANATGTWNISVTGNAGTVTNGVYTGRTLTAGSGLVGGGDLSSDKTFNVGQGDGITVSADSIAVDSTVVRTTGTQGINGLKSFYNNAEFGFGTQTTVFIGENLGPGGSGVGVFDFNTPLAAQYWLGTQDIIHYAYGGGTLSSPRIAVREDSGNVGIGISTPLAKLHVNGSGIFASGLNIANQTASTIASFDGNKNVVSLSTGTYPSLTELSYVKGVTSAVQTQLNNKIAKTSSTTIGNIPTWSVTTGDALGTGYSVETTLTGGAGALPRADAVKTYIDSAITSGFSTNDAMVFKGTLGSGGTVTALPTGTVSAGWSYRVITTGTYAGVVSEIGDLIIAVADAAGNVNSTWTVVQTNIDGAVVGPASSTTNALAVFNGTTGKLIQNSSFVPTTVGGNLINLTNPGAIRFVRINADNTVSSLSDSDFRTAIGAYASSNPSGYTTNVGTVTTISAGNGMNYSPITSTGSVVLGTPSSVTLSSTNSVTSTSHTHAFSPGGTTSQYIRGDGVATSGAALTKTDDTNVTLTIGGSPTNALLSATSLALGWTGNLAVNRGGTAQTSYTDGQLLIGNSTGNTLTKATLTQGANVTITNGNGSITIAATDTNTATAADDILDGSNTGTQITYAPYATNQAASASPRFYNTADNPSGSGRLNVSAYFYATRLFDNGSRVVTAATICADAGDCTWDGGSF